MPSLGRTTVQVSRVSLGTAPIGGLYNAVGDGEAQRTLEAAWEAGIRFFDTAPHYGAGLSERRLGRFLAGQERDSFSVSTKVGRLLRETEAPVPAEGFAEGPRAERVFDFSRDGVLRSLEESLERLGLDRVDVLLIHDPDDHWRPAVEEAYPALHDLRDQGVIGAIGVGMNQAAMPARFVAETDIDCVLLAGRYTLLDQSGLENLLPLCDERDVSVLAAGVFNSGVLADPGPGATYDYQPAPPATVERARRIQEVCARHGVPLAAAALQFPLGHPAVAAVVVGARSPGEVAADMQLAGTAVPAEMWRDLQAEGLLPAGAPAPGGD